MAPGEGVSPDKAQIIVANNFYARKLYDPRRPRGTKRYLGIYANGADRQTALFLWLGECYNKIGNLGLRQGAVTPHFSRRFERGDFIPAPPPTGW